jgi:N-acetylmuramoyl-L-alanine amidase
MMALPPFLLALAAAALLVAADGGDSGRRALEFGRPSIVASPIPFPPQRKRETKRYARRHYGIATYRLRRPNVIVEHFTGSDSYRSAYRTFMRDVPDVELHELPGLCAHFVIDRRGVIHQLVPLSLICRHTVGLNWTAIGIEHVGRSDRQVLSNRRQLDASLRLTRWLQGSFGIKTKNVIGHSESLSSPYHHERVASLRRQTHSDFSHATMTRYRRRLVAARTAVAARATTRVRRVRLGRSVQGRPIEAVERGDPGAAQSMLVVGSIHGDERAGIAVTRDLERWSLPAGVDVWVIETLNPDGVAAHTRQNARGVDLNRNFARRWRRVGRRGDRHYSGARPVSEPETKVARSLVLKLRPEITVWLHQPFALVDRSGGDVAVERRFARLARLPLRRIPPYPGTATRWQNHRLPGTTAFVVELPPGRIDRASVHRYSAALASLARWSVRRAPK